VDRHVAAGDVVAEVLARAAAQNGRELSGQRVLQVGDERGWQVGRRQLTVAAREVDVLREDALGADGVVRVLPGGRRLRDEAVDDEVAQVDLLHVVPRQVDVEVEDGHREVRPDDHVGEDCRRRRVVDREQGGDSVRIRQIDLEIGQQQSCRRHVVDGADDGSRRDGQPQKTGSKEGEGEAVHDGPPFRLRLHVYVCLAYRLNLGKGEPAPKL